MVVVEVSVGLFLRRTTKKKALVKSELAKHALSFEALESRLMLSADAFGGLFDADDIAPPPVSSEITHQIREDLLAKLSEYSVTELSQSSERILTVKPDGMGLDKLETPLSLNTLENLWSNTDIESGDPPVAELVFIDSGVENADELLSGLDLDPSTLVYTVDGDVDGLREVSDIISQYENLQAVHIFSHGSEAQLQLGNSAVSFLPQSSQDSHALIAGWQNSMAEGADLLLYACDFAASEAGQSAVVWLAGVSGMDVATSTDMTGAATLGGDWHLEFAVGDINTQVLESTHWQSNLATIVVNTTEDQSLSFGINSVSQLLAQQTEISLREAISAVNAETFGTETHTIVFDLDGDHTIELSNALPSIQRSVIIDGTTEPDYVDSPVVIVDGWGNVFNLSGSGIELRGIEITGGSNGVVISGNDNTLVGNHIHGNAFSGIDISGSGNQIGGTSLSDRNIIFNNAGYGIEITGSWADANIIEGNWVGVALDGFTDAGNGGSGIYIGSGADETRIGGSVAGAGNLISGNDDHGIHITLTNFSSATDHSILGNIVGLDSTGTQAVGNTMHGIYVVNAQNIFIGDGTEGGRNIISGNSGHGIELQGADLDNALVMGNYIGTDITGTVALGNEYNGVEIYGGPSVPWTFPGSPSDFDGRVIIGGAETGQGNVISGNAGFGVLIDKGATKVSVFGNIIGLDVSGVLDLGNGGSGIGVNVGASSPVSAFADISGNKIAFNARNGIEVGEMTHNVKIHQNLIYDNGLLGVDLNGDGFTENDVGDLDSGANRLVNFPDISTAEIADGLLHLEGELVYASASGEELEIHFYLSDHETAEGYANAETYIGVYNFTADNSGVEYFDVSFDVDIPADSFITSASTGRVGSSEFSHTVYMAQGNTANQLPEGAVTIAGSLIQGAILAASSSITDPNGISSPLQYQWRRNGEAIASATDETYTLTQADVGAQIAVDVFYVDDDGFAETVSSDATGTIANLNDVATGTLSIIGNRVEDQILTLNYSITDADGVPSDVIIQWLRDGNEIASANDNTYTLGDEDVGTQISARIDFVDLQGSAETLTSAATVAIENINDAPDATLTILGTAIEDGTLNANATINDADGVGADLMYQWLRDGVAISGATEDSYILTDSDVGSQIAYTVTYQDGHGAIESVTSDLTPEVENVNDAPQGSLVITGPNVEGEILTAQVGFTDADGISGPISYQWFRGGVAIAGAVNPTYTISNDDVGQQLQVRANYIDDYGNNEQVSSGLTNVVNNTNQSPTGSVSIQGTVEQGQTLSVNIAIDDADGLPGSYAYQWYRDGNAVLNAQTDQYVLTNDDVGAQMSVEVSYVDNLGSQESVSSEMTTAVTNVNDSPSGAVSIVGANREGETLTLQHNVSDPDGMPSNVSYQWYRGADQIVGATGSSYELTAVDIGTQISVKLYYFDLQGTYEEVFSDGFGPIDNVNQLPEGSLDITGTPEENSTLAVANNFTDTDGLPSQFAYQWHRDNSPVEGATGSTYLLTQEDVGSQIHVTVVYVDLMGTDEQLISSQTTAISNANDLPIGTLDIRGTGMQGNTLVAAPDIVDEDGIGESLGYQWYRNGQAIDGATNESYQLVEGDVGADIYVRWQYQDDFGQLETVQSSSLVNILNRNDSPTGSVVISGDTFEGGFLTVSNTIDDADGFGGVVTYQWYRNSEILVGETSDQLQLGDDSANATYQVLASYVDDRGTRESVVSSSYGPITPVNDDPNGSVVLQGASQEDQTLSFAHDISDPDGISGGYSYQWLRNNQVIDGAVQSTYTLSDNDVSANISVVVSYTDDGGSQEQVISNSVLVAGLNDAPEGVLAVQGNTLLDSTLSVANSVTDVDGIPSQVSYQWYRDGELITGATDTSHTLVAADVGAQLQVAMTYQDLQGTTESVLSAPSATVMSINHAASGNVVIHGGGALGEELVAVYDIRDIDGVASPVEVRWLRDGKEIEGVQGDRYVLTELDIGRSISIAISYTDGWGYQETLTSSALAIPFPEALNNTVVAPTVTPEIELDVQDTPTNLETENPRVIGETISIVEPESSELNDSDMALQSHHASVFIQLELDHDRFREHLRPPEWGALDYMFTENLPTDYDDISIQPPNSLSFSVYGDMPKESDLQDSQLGKLLNILNNRDFRDQLDGRLSETPAPIMTTRAILGGTTAVSTGLSLGYLAWTLRSGLLMTSLLGSLPAWRFVDPLPILESEQKKADDDDESLESMVQTAPQETIAKAGVDQHG